MIKGGTLLRSRDVILLILYQSPSCRQGNLILVTRTYNISTVYFLLTGLGSGTMGKKAEMSSYDKQALRELCAKSDDWIVDSTFAGGELIMGVRLQDFVCSNSTSCRGSSL